MKRLRLVGLMSGAGSTLHNLIETSNAGRLAGEVVGVVSSSPLKTKNQDIFRFLDESRIPLKILPRKSFTNDREYSLALTDVIRPWGPDLICMGGWLCYYAIPKEYEGRVINIHPSLLPKFGGHGCYGDRVHEAVLAAKETESGCTVHYADEKYDHGPIILRRKVSVRPDDSPLSLRARINIEEKTAYPEAINMIAKELSD